MKRTVWLWQLVGFALTTLLGTLLHFMYEWLGEPLWIAPFSGVNESTWEHMKLLFWPMLLYALFTGFFFRAYSDFWCVKLRGTLLGLVSIPVIFYTYNGVIGKSPDWVNIAIFFVAAALSYAYETRALMKSSTPCNFSRICKAAFFTIALAFVIFTFKTPMLNIFKDPITNAYGL